MSKFRRTGAFFESDVDVSADEFWVVLRDWAGVMKWADLSETAPAPLIDTTLREGDSGKFLPCTRICHFDTSGGFPPTFEETLLLADPESRRIYYNVEGVQPSGMRNYMATTIIDEIGPGQCHVTCSSTFDVPAQDTSDTIKEFLEAVYERSVVRGMERVAKAARAG